MKNLILFIIQNSTYEITGNQPVPGASRVDYATLARGAGFERAYFFEDAQEYAARLPEAYPQYFSRGEGCRLWDVDGREYIDFMCAWGPMVLGYRVTHEEQTPLTQVAPAVDARLVKVIERCLRVTHVPVQPPDVVEGPGLALPVSSLLQKGQGLLEIGQCLFRFVDQQSLPP